MYECKEYIGYKNKEGYGQISYKGKTWLVHRLVFFLIHGYLPEVVMHICDNPSCHNQAHLIEGTRDLNNKDRARKGRSAYNAGELHGRALLTEVDVIFIREQLATKVYGIGRRLAKHFGVSDSTISLIKLGKHWNG